MPEFGKLSNRENFKNQLILVEPKKSPFYRYSQTCELDHQEEEKQENNQQDNSCKNVFSFGARISGEVPASSYYKDVMQTDF